MTDPSAVPAARTAAVAQAPSQAPSNKPAASPRSGRKPWWLRTLRRSPLHLTILVLCAIWLTPALGLLITSFRTPGDTAKSGWWDALTAPAFTVHNYTDALDGTDITDGLLNSLLIAVPTTVVTVLVSAFAGYAFAWMRFRGRGPLFLVVIGLLVVPPQVTLVPMMKLLDSLGLMGTVPAVWIYQVGFTLPFGIFLLRNFFAAMPKELLDAAQVDGAGQMRIFLKIVLPTSGPALASLAILQFIWSWNDLLTPLLFMGGQNDGAPVTVQIAGLVQSTGEGQNLLTAATFLAVLLPLIVFFSLQRYYARGMMSGSVKG
ncbi:MAG: carbohydrate ABC transporter permease [Saccharothrix sp.]|nr:carbohydrate ABC transporter permease [Saccharothrix sp.]